MVVATANLGNRCKILTLQVNHRAACLIGTRFSSTRRSNCAQLCEIVNIRSWSSSKKRCSNLKSGEKESTSSVFSSKTSAVLELIKPKRRLLIGGSKWNGKKLSAPKLLLKKSGRRQSKWLKTPKRVSTRFEAKWISTAREPFHKPQSLVDNVRHLLDSKVPIRSLPSRKVITHWPNKLEPTSILNRSCPNRRTARITPTIQTRPIIRKLSTTSKQTPISQFLLKILRKATGVEMRWPEFHPLLWAVLDWIIKAWMGSKLIRKEVLERYLHADLAVRVWLWLFQEPLTNLMQPTTCFVLLTKSWMQDPFCTLRASQERKKNRLILWRLHWNSRGRKSLIEEALSLLMIVTKIAIWQVGFTLGVSAKRACLMRASFLISLLPNSSNG